ncbi:MAG TPA: response regulator transcription factor [Flavobacteriales bacterium]
MSKQKILLVDDEKDILELLTYNLEKEGYKVITAKNGSEAVALAKAHHPDLILMDVMMPEMDGMEACRLIREEGTMNNIVIAFLTARSEDYSQIAGFDAGADDYIAKPIKPRVLLSRVKALLRRSPSSQNGAEPTTGLIIDKSRYLVIKDGVEHSLPRKEFELVALLASEPGHVFTREVILSNVWGNDVVVGDRTIDVHIRKLREKLGENLFKTIKGVGYKYEE